MPKLQVPGRLREATKIVFLTEQNLCKSRHGKPAHPTEGLASAGGSSLFEKLLHTCTTMSCVFFFPSIASLCLTPTQTVLKKHKRTCESRGVQMHLWVRRISHLCSVRRAGWWSLGALTTGNVPGANVATVL